MRRIAILYIFLFLGIDTFSQERNHLPYSIYGIGELVPKGSSRNIAMGRAGIALASQRNLNNQNPATYSFLDSISFFFDFGLSSDFVKYKTSAEGTQKGMDINLKNIDLGFRINKRWTSAIGIAPFSNVGYRIDTQEEIEGTIDEFFDIRKTGNGGLRQFYWNNSVELFKRFSLGVSFNYLFGKIESTEEVTLQDFNSEFISENSYFNKVYLDFGIFYYFPYKNDFLISVGGIFGTNHNINRKDELSIYKANSLNPDKEILRRTTFELPLHIGSGIAVNYKNNLTVTADYTYYYWSNTSYESNYKENVRFNYKNNNVFKFGLEYIPGRYSGLGFFGNLAYRLGYYYEQSYLQVNDKIISDNGISAGIGFPFLQNRTTLNVAYNYGVKGTIEKSLIKSNYHFIAVSLTLHDWWFIKRKIN